MKKTFNNTFLLIVISAIFSSCASIVGGTKYNAFITVEDHPDAIVYNGKTLLGTGSGFTSIPRKDANKVIFTVQKDGCPAQEFQFRSRKFRFWTFIGDFFMPTAVVGGFPIPFPHLIDFSTGAYYKPNANNPSITKGDYKNFYYTLIMTVRVLALKLISLK